MRMLDLFCGRWGWSRAFAARGWECVGVDLYPQEPPDGCEFIRADAMQIGGFWIKHYAKTGFDFICASPPCEQFSVWGMAHFHPNPKYPETGIALFNHTRAICEASGIPYLIENVRPAQSFVGMAKHRCGPFALWGNGVPPLMPQGITKGFGTMDYDRDTKQWNNELNADKKNRASIAATIPPELAACVAEYAERICEASVE